MFRTARAFLLVAPVGFVLVLVAFLVAHPHASESFLAYPLLADALGAALSKRPLVRFIAASIVLFIPPYLMSGLLLLFADLGVSAAAPLWLRRPARRPAASVPPESRWAFLVSTALFSLGAGISMHRVARGGELQGGVNVGPLLVVLASFVAMAAALVVGGLVAIPRGLIVALRKPR
jgi:hypothetical protein